MKSQQNTTTGEVLLGWALRALLCVALGLLVRHAAAHDLHSSRLVIRPGPNTLVGELMMPSQHVDAADLGSFLADNLKLEFDGHPASGEVTVLSAGKSDDPIGNHLVEILWWQPVAAHSFTITPSDKLGALALSVERHSPGGLVVHSAFVGAGTASPPYSLQEAAPVGWQAGGIDQLPSTGMPTGSAGASSDGAPQSNAANAPTGGFEETLLQSVGRYLRLGFVHILPRGLDHMLFVLGLVLFSRRPKDLLLQLSLFTVAHTATLALSTLGTVRLPTQIVEPAIAFSIAYVGVENLFPHRVVARRMVVVFLFGLVHGLGFAGVLGNIGLPARHFLVALLSFNAGVELGQLVVVVALLVLFLPIRDRAIYERWVTRYGSVAIALVGCYWGVTRIIAG